MKVPTTKAVVVLLVLTTLSWGGDQSRETGLLSPPGIEFSGRHVLRRIVEAHIDYDSGVAGQAGFCENFVQIAALGRERAQDRPHLDDDGVVQTILHTGANGGVLEIPLRLIRELRA